MLLLDHARDRPESRQAFVSKCETYLRNSVGLVIVDMVTQRRANLHNELMQRLLGSTAEAHGSDLYAVAYRAVQRVEATKLDVGQEPLTLGQALPTLPLWLRGGLCLPIDLGGTYKRTCREQRVTANGA